MAYAFKGKGVLLVRGKIYGDDLDGVPEDKLGGNEIPEEFISDDLAKSLGDKLVKAAKVKTAAEDKGKGGKK